MLIDLTLNLCIPYLCWKGFEPTTSFIKESIYHLDTCSPYIDFWYQETNVLNGIWAQACGSMNKQATKSRVRSLPPCFQNWRMPQGGKTFENFFRSGTIIHRLRYLLRNVVIGVACSVHYLNTHTRTHPHTPALTFTLSHTHALTLALFVSNWHCIIMKKACVCVYCRAWGENEGGREREREIGTGPSPWGSS